MIPASIALARLREGNRRYVSGETRYGGRGDERLRAELLEGQEPFAIVLGCSDSRVPAELVFDQGLGDLFVVRVAGNIAASSQIASVEFAAEQFGTRLVVVLGHSRCGAVTATIEALLRPAGEPSPALRSLLDRVRPAVESLLESASADDDELIREAVRANVRNTVRELRRSRPLHQLIETDGLCVVGAEYCLEKGEVEFFDGVPVSG